MIIAKTIVECLLTEYRQDPPVFLIRSDGSHSEFVHIITPEGKEYAVHSAGLLRAVRNAMDLP